MNDHDDFERQVSEAMRRGGRPSRPVDVASIVRSATQASPVSRWSVVGGMLGDDAPSASAQGGLSMFSAAKLVAAVAIVALFGGLLAVGVLDPRSGDPAPAAMTDGLLTGMVTEEVEPGVTRVIDDGYRDLGHLGRTWGINGGVVVTGADTPWLYDGMGRLVRIGDEAVYELADPFLMDWEPGADEDHTNPVEADARLMHGSPDGRLWLISGNEIFFFDPERGEWDPWNSDVRAAEMAVDDQGTVWAILTDELVRFAADGTPTRFGLPDGYREIDTLVVSPDGAAYVLARPSSETGEYAEEADVLRLVDGEFVPAMTLAPPLLFPPAAGPGGVLWSGGGYDWDAGDFPHADLRRLDEDGWTVFTAEDGIEPWGGKPGFYPLETIVASPDGSVWVDATKAMADEGDYACEGLGRFDGESWTSYLSDHCIADIDFTSDGDAWVLAEGPYLEDDALGVFLVRP